MEGFEKMVVYGVSFDVVNKQPIVLLKVENGNRYLPIWIGHPEAAAILMKLQDNEMPRPMTHDLLTNVIDGLAGRVDRVLVTELRENTFYAQLHLVQNEHELEIDSRPSDAIALAVRTDAPIYASDNLIEQNGIEFDPEEDDVESVVEEFRDFLEDISPEDFSS